MGGILSAIDISARGLSVQRAKMNVVAENMANAETTETPEGGPYRRRRVVVSEQETPASFNTVLRKADRNLARTHEGHRKGKSIQSSGRGKLTTVSSEEVEDRSSAVKLVHDPGHPNADEKGYVQTPDIDVVEEMVDMMAAARAYEANTVAISAAKTMAKDALEI